MSMQNTTNDATLGRVFLPAFTGFQLPPFENYDLEAFHARADDVGFVKGKHWYGRLDGVIEVANADPKNEPASAWPGDFIIYNSRDQTFHVLHEDKFEWLFRSHK